MICHQIIPMQQHFRDGVAFISEKFNIQFYSEIIQAKCTMGFSVGVYGLVAVSVEFEGDVTGGFDLEMFVLKAEGLDEVHPGGFSATDGAC